MTDVAELIERVQGGESSVEIVYGDAEWPKITTANVQIAVLDSSFNPPTRAHLALAKSAPAEKPRYNATLFLLSVRNADKKLQPGDATFAQRLRMVDLLVRDTPELENVAIAVIDEPTFIGKSSILTEFIRQRTGTRPRLSFIMGMDTLARLFEPKYYGDSEEDMVRALDKFFSPTHGDGSIVVCARRPNADEESVLKVADKYVKSGVVNVIDIGSEESTFSSTAIRRSRQEGNDAWKSLVTVQVAAYIEDEGLYLRHF